MTTSKKVAQLTTYFITADSTSTNINMRIVLGETNFKLGEKYNLVLRAQMNDVRALNVDQQANRFLLSSNMMRFQNYETAAGKISASGQLVTYASFPMFYSDGVSCNSQILSCSCIHTFTLEAEMGYITIQAQNQTNNTLNGLTLVYPNYLFIFDIYKCEN
jgi:hypothetical protein